MVLKHRQSIVKIEYWIDVVGFSLIGAYIIGSSIWQASFAKMYLCFPYSHFPIFVGEFCLLFCSLLLFGKMLLRKAIDPWQQRWLLYGLCVCALTVYGLTQEGGLLAFRQAAMFNYVFFALFTFSFYRSDFLNKIYVYRALLVLAIVMAYFIKDYYWLLYYVVAFILLLRLRSKIWIFTVMGIIGLSHLGVILLGSRSHLVALVAIAIFMSCAVFSRFVEWSMRVKWAVAILFIFCVGAGIIHFADQNAIKSMTNIIQLIDRYKFYKKLIKERERHFVTQPLQVLLYNSEVDQIRFNVFPKASPVQQPLVKEERMNFQAKMESGQSRMLPMSRSNAAQSRVSVLVKPEINDVKPENPIVQAQLLPVHVKPEILDVKSEDLIVQFIPHPVVDEKPKERNIVIANHNILFRLFIWEDMVKDLWNSGSVFGVGFGKIHRSRSIEILGWADSEWKRQGWITPHNSYLHLIYRAGILGLLMIIALLMVFIRLFKQFIRQKSIQGVLLLAVVLYWMVMANFLLILELPYYAILFWSLLGVTYAYAQHLEEGK